jgi:hypothetical protein
MSVHTGSIFAALFVFPRARCSRWKLVPRQAPQQGDLALHVQFHGRIACEKLQDASQLPRSLADIAFTDDVSWFGSGCHVVSGLSFTNLWAGKMAKVFEIFA